MSTWLQNILAAAVGAETALVPVLVKHPTAEKILAVILVAEESVGSVLGLNLNPGIPAGIPGAGTAPAPPHP